MGKQKNINELREKIAQDRRFIKTKTNKSKIRIDKRFKEAMRSGEFGEKGKIDKYGRRIEEENGLKRYYDIEENESEDKKEDNDEEKTMFMDYARGKVELESDSEETSEDDIEVEKREGELNKMIDEIPLGDKTSRLAMLNCNWDVMGVKEIRNLAEHFKPKGGEVKSVKLYVSEYGKERLEKERVLGPDENDFKVDESLYDSEEEIKMARLKKYQLSRLKYYYAVIECDSIDTGSAIYDALDGREFEDSCYILDLRFIPDDQVFNEENIKPIEDKAVDKFNVGLVYHTKPRLCWEDDIDKRKVLKKRMTEAELDEMYYEEYLGSSAESSDIGLEELRKEINKSESDKEEDIEITFDRPEVPSEKGEEEVKEKKLRKKKSKEKEEDSEWFKINTEDPRFQSVYGVPEYTIDPTHPSYKNTKNMTEILKKRIERNKK